MPVIDKQITSTRIVDADTVEIPTPLTPTDLAKKLNELEKYVILTEDGFNEDELL